MDDFPLEDAIGHDADRMGDRTLAGDTVTLDLGVLTSRQRMVVVLHYYDNWTILEIADAIGITARNVKRCHSRAILRLHDDASPLNRSYKVDA